MDEISRLEGHIERAKNYLQSLNSQISAAEYTLDCCHGTEQRT